MSRKTGQIIARGDSRWHVRVYLGRDRESGKRAYVYKHFKPILKKPDCRTSDSTTCGIRQQPWR
jgi:hypothetical protein